MTTVSPYGTGAYTMALSPEEPVLIRVVVDGELQIEYWYPERIRAAQRLRCRWEPEPRSAASISQARELRRWPAS